MRDAPSLRRRRDDTLCPPPKKLTLARISRVLGREALPLHILFECATGYALFLTHGINDVDMHSYQEAEEYINRSDGPFELKAYLPFSSLDDALVQFNAISFSTEGQFIVNHVRHCLRVGGNYMISTQETLPLHILFECATRYALFLAYGINDIDIKSYQEAEEYINRSDSPFELKAYLPFSSLDDAIVQFNAVSRVT